MASRGASLFAFFFCNEKKKGGFGAPPQEVLCAVWAGLSSGAVWLNATLAPRDRPDGQRWKKVAHQTQTRGKMLFFPLCVKIPAYQMPPAVRRSSLALPFVPVQE